MDTAPRWPHCLIFLCMTWTNVHVCGQKYYINLYGPNSYEGTVELSDGLSWYTLHQQGWNDRNAEVTCRMLGYYGESAMATFGSMLYNSSRPAWDVQFNCDGNETSLSDCKTIPLNLVASKTSVGVKCPSNPAVEYDDFLLQWTSPNTISKVNVVTMSGWVNTNTRCFKDIPTDMKQVVYDPLYDRIIYSKDSSLWSCSFGGGKTELYRFVSVTYVGSLALDQDDRILFYFSNGAVSRLALDDASAIPTFILNITTASSISVDSVHKELYIANHMSSLIERANYNGSSRGVLSAISRSAFASNIAFSDGVMFWSDSRIEGILNTGETLYMGITPCERLYVIGEWLYCISNRGVLRLEKNGKCGSPYGPIIEDSYPIIQYNDGLDANKEPLCQHLYINLFGKELHEGTIELSNGIDWHILCSEDWNDNNAAVACRMLGYSGDGARALLSSGFAAQASLSWNYKFHCKGDESVLSECNTSSRSSMICSSAGVQCSKQKVVPDFFLKRTVEGMSKINPLTMSGSIILNNPCKFEYNHDVIYDAVNDQFLSFENGSLWGCGWGSGYKEIRRNTSVLSYTALDSGDQLLFGYWNSNIVSLGLDDTSADLVVVVHRTTVKTRLVLDTKRKEIYWWTNLGELLRITYHGDSKTQFWGTSNPVRPMTFKDDSLFFIDPDSPRLFRKRWNKSTYLVYHDFAVLHKQCTDLFVDHEWIYCKGYSNNFWGILRLKKDGTGGNLFGPLGFSRTAFPADIIYHYSPNTLCKICNIVLKFDSRCRNFAGV